MSPITGKGEVTQRLNILESMITTMMGLLLRHDFALRQLDRETCWCICFKEINIITQCLVAAKLEWNEARLPGKSHPSGRGFKAIAWELMWGLAAKALETPQAGNRVDEEDANYIQRCIEVLQGAGEGLLRFYPVQLKPRETKAKEGAEDAGEAKGEGEDEGMGVGDAKRSAQVWILKVSDDKEGQDILQALQGLDQGLSLDHLMDAELRRDRAPTGSMAKALGDAWHKMTAKKD